jgi:hypothetical protein
MKYDFTSRERDFGRIVFVLTLDRKKLTERIVIARSDEARLRLERGAGDVYFDETHPLGSLLLNFESDGAGEWNKKAAILRESYGKAIPLTSARWKLAAPVGEYLRGKYESGEPSAIFAAVRTWDEYLNCFNLNHGADLLTERLSTLHKPFSVYADYKPWREESAAALSVALRDGESSVELWYPVAKRLIECVAVSASFLPLIAYYLYKIAEWGFVFQQCKVCGKDFLARSRHYELCGDECRQVQALTNKREFDERAKGDKLEQLHENAYNYWYNRLRKLKRGDATDPIKAANVGAAFKEYRKEAVKRKTAMKNGELSFSDFTAWLAEQQNTVDKLMSERQLPYC